MLVASLFLPVIVTQVVLAAGEDFSAVSDKTGKPGQDTAITDLQITGTGDDEVSVRLNVEAGEMYFDDVSNVTFSGDSWGRNIAFSGLRSDVNNVLATLYYENDQEGTFTIEVTLGGGNYNNENGHVYLVVGSPGISWIDAKDAAEAMEYGGVNGYLATITSQEEHDFIRERINDSGWIGASDDGDGNEGIWRWVTGPEAGTQFWAGDEEGEPFNDAYANWNEGEPNNSGEGENCGQIWFEDDSDGLWNDLDCESEENEYYVVEFGGDTEESLPEIISTSFDVVVARDLIQVGSCNELFDLGSEHAGDKIELTADIDCGGRTEAPLFDEEDFSGIFEGNGFVIKNLTIANEDSSHVGLTGYSVGAEYRNIFLDNITVNGGYHNGVLAGHVEESIIAENIHASNISMNGVSGEDYVEQMGVLFGTVELEHHYGESRIEHVSVQGTFNISDVEYVWGVGGIAGTIESEGDLVIRQAYADVDIVISNVDWSENVGGLIGYVYIDGEDDNEDKDLVQGISDSYTWGTITAAESNNVGGLIGYIDQDSEDDADMTFAIDNSYSWMDITASAGVGGLIGYIEDIDDEGGTYSYEVNNSFYAGTLDSESDTGIIIGYYDDYEEEYSTLSFDNVWYDASKVDGYDCVGNMSVDECHAANSDGSQPNYFINNKTNAPMNEWNFTTIWKTQAGTPPVFKPFIGNDGDQDGANDYIEDRAPNGGDANNDGIQDSQQTYVASFRSSVNNQYISVVVDDECDLVDVGAVAEAVKAVQDSGYTYPAGLTHFTADCGTLGYTTTATLYFYGVDSGLTVRKYNPNTNVYFTVTSATKSAQTIGGEAVTVVSYQITDGGTLDTDGVANSVIVDPVGLGVLGVSAPNTGAQPIRAFLFRK